SRLLETSPFNECARERRLAGAAGRVLLRRELVVGDPDPREQRVEVAARRDGARPPEGVVGRSKEAHQRSEARRPVQDVAALDAAPPVGPAVADRAEEVPEDERDVLVLLVT